LNPGLARLHFVAFYIVNKMESSETALLKQRTMSWSIFRHKTFVDGAWWEEDTSFPASAEDEM